MPLLLAPAPPQAAAAATAAGAAAGAAPGAAPRAAPRAPPAPSAAGASAAAAGAAACAVAGRSWRRGTGAARATRALARVARRAAPFDPRGAESGITAPMGYWDPLGLMKDGLGEWRSEATFRQYQEAEIKHGRVAMMAILGTLSASLWRFGGYENVDEGWAALQTPEGGAGFGMIFLCAAYFELKYKQDPEKPPGNLGDPAGILKWGYSGAGSKGTNFRYNAFMRNAEINHGRLAMSGFATGALAEYGAGMGPTAQLNYLREHPSEVSVTFLAILWILSPDKGGSMVQTKEEIAPIEDAGSAQPIAAAK